MMWLEEEISTVKHVFFSLSPEGSLVDIWAYQPYTLVGPPVCGLVIDPLAAFTSTTVYLSPDIDKKCPTNQIKSGRKQALNILPWPQFLKCLIADQIFGENDTSTFFDVYA